GVAGTSSAGLDFSNFGIEWAGIDSIQAGGQPVTGYTITSATGINWAVPYGQCCIGDADCDGDADSDDVILFFGAWDNGESGGDTDHDGDTDSDDIVAFFESWDSGC
ncbi:MAG: hypothetical protein PSX37_11085, partial [bacterium]|nr:hypothetical protein [bacterium]